jgi:hypothetical protein
MGLHVEGVRPSAMMKKFGGSLSLQGRLEFLKVQIASSESFRKGKGKGKSRQPRNISVSADSFLCESFTVNVAMKDVVDFERNDTGSNDAARQNFSLKFAMHKLEAKPTTLQVCM